MHTGGVLKQQKPTHPMECVKHGLRLVRSSAGNCDLWTCPACNAEVIDRWAKQPGAITVTVNTKRP